MDLVYRGHRHVPFASLSPALADRTITCVAPSKTFNIAGLNMSLVIASNAGLLARYNAALTASGLGIGNLFGTIALETAYRQGGEWLDQLLAYLEGNVDFAEAFFRDRIPSLRFVRPEGTYLALIDCRGLGLTQPALDEFFLRSARVYFDSGPMFGEECTGFERINFGCPRPVLQEALERLERAVAGLT
jgi:cystathionine beta-lyase